jgi:hypothetical protein
MVSTTFDNLKEVERQIKLAQRRIWDSKMFLAERHLERALYHLDLHARQQAEMNPFRESLKREHDDQ